MTRTPSIPHEFESVRNAALRALGPVRPADSSTQAEKNFLFDAKRTDAGRDLPPYYLVYFLLVDLLGFKDLGQWEKVAWSVPIDFNGEAFLIEHRKLGLGIFARDPAAQETDAKKIVIRIQKAVKAARPFFDWLASQAVASSHVNVHNNSAALYERYEFLLKEYRAKQDEAVRRKDECIVKKGKNKHGTWSTYSYPAYRLRREASWLALSVVEAFFSWTEHALIHLAILTGKISSAEEVAFIAAADWPTKFRTAIDITPSDAKSQFDRMVSIRQDLRNHVAHGAFGKQGEAFSFHSGAGAVPVLLPHKRGSNRFILDRGLEFDTEAALAAIEQFTAFLWSGHRSPARLYIQESHLPVILTYATNGTYAQAMASTAEMESFVKYLSNEVDNAANMDW